MLHMIVIELRLYVPLDIFLKQVILETDVLPSQSCSRVCITVHNCHTQHSTEQF